MQGIFEQGVTGDRGTNRQVTGNKTSNSNNDDLTKEMSNENKNKTSP